MNPSPDSLRHEINLAGAVCGIGLIWSARTWATSYFGFSALALTPGPLEFCGVGSLIWLLARWQLVRRNRERADCVAVQAQ